MSEDEAKAIVGDGLARVSASLEMKDTNYGTGCGAHITVSLACDQNIEGIHLAHSIASALAEEFLAESFDSALAVFNHKIAEKH